MRLQFDVVDLEATMHVRDTGWDFLVAAGARLAAIEADEAIVNGAPFHEQGDFGGVTLASEGRRSLIAGNNWSANAVCGGRLSMLKGAWSGPLVPYNATDYYRDYNERYLVPEVFAGLEASYGHAFSRVTVEIQDWRGGTLGAPRHDYAFTGFGFDVGWTF